MDEFLKYLMSLAGLGVLALVSFALKKFTNYLQIKSNSSYDNARNEKIASITYFVSRTIDSIVSVKANGLIKDGEPVKFTNEEITDLANSIVGEVTSVLSDSIRDYMEKQSIDDWETWIRQQIEAAINNQLNHHNYFSATPVSISN